VALANAVRHLKEGGAQAVKHMAGLTADPLPRFVKRYADTRGGLLDAARRYAADVAGRRYPDQAHSYA
jgi:ketopantoate hydroxymethyltransferase